jgi:hypothetical protein
MTAPETDFRRGSIHTAANEIVALIQREQSPMAEVLANEPDETAEHDEPAGPYDRWVLPADDGHRRDGSLDPSLLADANRGSWEADPRLKNCLAPKLLHFDPQLSDCQVVRSRPPFAR